MRFKILIIILISNKLCISQSRIITAGSAITETVCALGECNKIVASDRTSLYPSSISKLPSIGYRNNIGAEGILSLNPTLVIAEKDYVKQDVLSQLTDSKIQLVIIDRKFTLEGTREMITIIAKVLNREENGKKLIAKLNKEIEESTALLAKATSRPTAMCIYNRGTAAISACGKDTFADILPYAGAINALNNVDGYKPINTESFIAANPDFIILTTTGLESIGGIEGLLDIPGVSVTTAGKKKQILSIDSLMLTNFGPRLGQAIRQLVMLLHPEVNPK